LKEVTSTFSRGKFEQELSGVLLKNLNQKQINQFRSLKPVPPKKDNPVPDAGTRKPMKFEEGSGGAAFGNPLAARRGQRYKATQADATGTNSATPAVNLTPRPAKAAAAPTSEGVPVGSAKPAATSPAPISKAAAQNISQTQNAYQNATEELRQARKYYPNKVAEAQQAVNTARNAWKSAVDASQVPDTQPGTNTQTMAPKDQ
jgi:hypothetical protein